MAANAVCHHFRVQHESTVWAANWHVSGQQPQQSTSLTPAEALQMLSTTGGRPVLSRSVLQTLTHDSSPSTRHCAALQEDVEQQLSRVHSSGVHYGALDLHR